MLFGSQISCADLRFLYSMLSDNISDRTIALLFPVTLLALTQPSNVSTFDSQRYKSTMQMCRRICAPPEINIRIFNPLSSFFYSTIAWCRLMCRKQIWMFFGSRCRLIMEKIGMYFGSQISCADLRFLYSMQSNFSLCSTTRAYPTEQ